MIVVAVQVPYLATHGELDRIARWCHGKPTATGVRLRTDKPITYAGPGWYIIRCPGGQYTVMSPGRFGALHDEVTS